MAIAQPAPNENGPTPPAPVSSLFDSLKRTGPGRVDRVIDGLTVTLKDKKVVRLAGIDIPGYGREDSDFPLKAFQALQVLLPEATDIALYQTRLAKMGRTNRMEQQLAHLVIEKDNIWIQAVMISMGVARVMPTESNPEMSEIMLGLEQKAREKELGVWAKDSPYRLLGPDDLSQKTGTIQVVEGTVVKAANIKNTLYLNFGTDWKTDFTVRINTDLRRKLSKAGIDPLALQGKRIRVRGYIEEYNGPMITLENIHHLEMVEKAAS